MQCVVGVEVLYHVYTDFFLFLPGLDGTRKKRKYKVYPCQDNLYISIEIIEGNAYLD